MTNIFIDSYCLFKNRRKQKYATQTNATRGYENRSATIEEDEDTQVPPNNHPTNNSTSFTTRYAIRGVTKGESNDSPLPPRPQYHHHYYHHHHHHRHHHQHNHRHTSVPLTSLPGYRTFVLQSETNHNTNCTQEPPPAYDEVFGANDVYI